MSHVQLTCSHTLTIIRCRGVAPFASASLCALYTITTTYTTTTQLQLHTLQLHTLQLHTLQLHTLQLHNYNYIHFIYSVCLLQKKETQYEKSARSSYTLHWERQPHTPQTHSLAPSFSNSKVTSIAPSGYTSIFFFKKKNTLIPCAVSHSRRDQNRCLHLIKRALCLMKRALYSTKKADDMYPARHRARRAHRRCLQLIKRALYLIKTPPYSIKRDERV